jgi:hypothetical protein
MSIPYWSPLAGAIQLQALHMQEVAAARKAGEAQLRELALAASRPKQPATRHVEQAKKCPGCGSHTYAVTLRGRICSYCRTPEGEGA